MNQAHRILTVAQFSALTGIEDGDEVYLEVDSTNGIVWHLRYVTAEVTYKWRYLGGSALYAEVATSETTTSTTYVALATSGPSVTLPRSGDYHVLAQAAMGLSSGAIARMSYDIGGTAAVDADSIAAQGGASSIFSASGNRRKTGLTPVTLTAKYKTTANTGSYESRRLSVVPIRIRHDA